MEIDIVRHITRKYYNFACTRCKLSIRGIFYPRFIPSDRIGHKTEVSRRHAERAVDTVDRVWILVTIVVHSES